MIGLYKFSVYLDRYGEVSGSFLAGDKAVEYIVGKKVDFGEILGRHSDVQRVIQPGDITLVTDAPGVVDVLRQGSWNIVGYNPVSIYLEHLSESYKDDLYNELAKLYCEPTEKL